MLLRGQSVITTIELSGRNAWLAVNRRVSE